MKLVRESSNQSKNDLEYLDAINEFWQTDTETPVEKLEAFTKYVSRQSLTKFLCRNEVFQKQLTVNGSIVELGVHRGASFMTWAHLSSVYEPVNYLRKIIGFDTFTGLAGVSEKDSRGTSEHLKEGGFDAGEQTYQSLLNAIDLFDQNRLMNHIPKCELIKGDACETIQQYLDENPHLLVSLLHLDADLYAPTKAALELLVPRMPKGAVILFDELNMDLFPGETLAMLESLDIRKTQIKRFPHATSMSYVVL